MTRRQHTVFTYLRRYWSEHGRSPSWRQIGSECGLSSSGNVYDALNRLAERGCIRRAAQSRQTTWIPFLDGRGL